MKKKERKANRLSKYDYSQPGAYFITVCTKDRRCILGEVVGATNGRLSEVCLSEYGKTVDKAIRNIHIHYPTVMVDRYVIMPNHIHLILRIYADENGRPMVAPTISTVIQQMKGYVTKQIGVSIWQKLFHDHIIRNSADYEKIWEYVGTNPAKWEMDCLYVQ